MYAWKSLSFGLWQGQVSKMLPDCKEVAVYYRELRNHDIVSLTNSFLL